MAKIPFTTEPELKPDPLKSVGKYDPRRILPGSAYKAPLTPSDIGKAGASYW